MQGLSTLENMELNTIWNLSFVERYTMITRELKMTPGPLPDYSENHAFCRELWHGGFLSWIQYGMFLDM